MNTSTDHLTQEATRFVNQMKARYGLPLLQKMYGNLDDFSATVSAGLVRGGVDHAEFKAVRDWLLEGLKPFVEYPPTLESLVHLVNLVKAYPLTVYSKSIKHVWFYIDSDYSHRYGRTWRGDNAFECLTKERVWISQFESVKATEIELRAALSRISESALFRNFAPSLEQFMDAISAVRFPDAPLVEEAWLIAISTQPGTPIHALVKKVRGVVGASELRTSVRDKDLEQNFKRLYRRMLSENNHDLSDIPEPAVEVQYANKEDVLRLFKQG
jgi:hypothetical protein